MADAEESPVVQEVAAAKEDEKPKQTANDETSVKEARTASHDQPVVTATTKKPRKDFWICCGLLVIFGLVCLLGFIVLKIVVFSEGSDKAMILTAQRYTGNGGVVPTKAKS